MFIVVGSYLNAPLNFIAKTFLIRKTNRNKSGTSINEYIDFVLVIILIVWVNLRANLGIYDGANNL